MTITKLDHVFINTIPDDLEDGTLYISLRFNVIMHSCCCGCKNKVVMPLSPVRWKMSYNGKTVSLYPSVGNWNFDCQSHYWIKDSKVEWAGKWNDDEVIEGKAFEREKRAEYFKKINEEKLESGSKIDNVKIANELKRKESLFVRIKRIFSKR